MKELVEYLLMGNGQRFHTPNEHRMVVINAAIIIDILLQARNAVVHNSLSVDLPALIASAKARVHDHMVGWDKVEALNPKRWRPPEPGWFKVNTDVAIRTQGSFYSAVVSPQFSFPLFCLHGTYTSYGPIAW